LFFPSIRSTGDGGPARSSAILPLFLALSVTAGCEGGGAAATDAIVVDTLASGTIVVTNPETGSWAADEAWTLVEDLSIGAVDGNGPDVFGQITAIAVDDEGRIHVLDQQASEVRSFTADGAHIRSLGREGSGPGEFRRPAGLTLDADGSLWVLDSGNARFVVFDREGEFVTTHRRPVSFFMMPWPGGFDREGRLHDVAVARAQGGASSETVVVRYDDALEVADTIRLPAFEPERVMVLNASGNPMMSVIQPFHPTLSWTLDPGGALWSGITDRYELVLRAMGGDTLRLVRKAHTPVPVTGAEADSARSGIRKMIEDAGPGASTEGEVSVHSRKPAFQSFFVGVGGHLWVIPLLPGLDTMRLDVFDPDGHYLGRVDPGFVLSTFPSPVFMEDAIYAVRQDGLGVASVVRLRIERRD
jgi:hypothetical protein